LEDKKSNIEEHKKKSTKMFTFLFACAFLIIIAVTIITVASKNPSQKKSSNLAAQTGEEVDNLKGDKQILAVLKEINPEDKTMTLLDIESGQEVSLSYTGGTTLVDKYEQVIATSQLSIGEMVDAYYFADTDKLLKLQISSLAWEYQGVNNWSIDQTKREFDIVDSKYKYSQNLVVSRQNQLGDVSDLNDKDELTIKGYEREIWSIIVTKGHGTLRLEDYDDFIGGTAYIGNLEVVPIVADMAITVQEGSYDITLEKGNLTGTKQVTVGANEEVIVNMGEFKNPVVQMGSVKFVVTPEGADLYVDDLLQPYESAVDLEYGEHTIKVTLGGYTAYAGTLEVDEASETLSIDLVENQDTTDTDTQNANTQDSENQVNSNGTVNNGTTNGDSNAVQTEDTTNNDNTLGTGQVGAGNYIYILNPVGASVYFDGNFKGVTPLSIPKQTGTFLVTLIKEGYKTNSYTMVVSDVGDQKDKDASFKYPDMTKSE